MQEQDVIKKFIELDDKIQEISAAREKQLAELEQRYKAEEQKIVEDLSKRLEEETNAVVKKIMQEAQEEVDNLNKKSKEVVSYMEQEFQNIHEELVAEILKRIFDIESERYG
ncbi:hypothetical protein TSYNTROOL_08810 [Tepidanaerobacter syntrophicus]|uniref:hypothetical protein n=1 Tax=Tepidanaerobacter syntrophicus TaxID=224999 RepID=UPI001BD681E1|nr:hypothetical protein [Tepidanaerobacter syntrophicus]GLI18720.1 hypothetical protein TSYNTROPHJE_05330 [Tepidanaerobacter syntrophicus]GLI50795.1 hypothetical protein TSYNTROOL_08810 [Tepidanaerobacter syntrophicus]